MFPGIVKMHREANTSENDKVFIKNKFKRSDVTNMTSDIDLDMSYADSSVLNKSNGVVTKGEVHLTEQLNFGEPVLFKKGSTANMMNVSFTSKVTLIDDAESRKSYLEEEELADVNVRDFVKLIAPKSNQTFRVKTSEREALNESSAESNEMNSRTADEDERETNLTTASHDSRHRNRRQNVVQKFLTAPRQETFTLFEKKIIGINMKVENTVRIESIKKEFNLKLEETEYKLTLKVGSKKVSLLRESIDTTKKETKKIEGFNVGIVSARI